MQSVDVRFVWYAFIVGYLSHLVMDTVTKEGVPWLLPIPFKFGFPPIRRLRITTDTWVEKLIVLPLLIFIAIFLIAHNYVEIQTFVHHFIER